jgi:hypothetical protein
MPAKQGGKTAMLEFQEQPKYENLLTLRKDDPARYERLAQSERDAAESYADLKREQTRTKRPLRRRYMDAEEKANYIRDHGQEKYLGLPF